MTRCEVCGRPPQSEIDAGKESLLPGEIACQGCHDEYLAFAADPDNTDAQALAMARRKHEAREAAQMRAVILERYERNAAGLHGATGLPLALSGAELQGVKADAAKMVARLRGL